MNRTSFSSFNCYNVGEVELNIEHVYGTGGSLYPRLVIPCRFVFQSLTDVRGSRSDLWFQQPTAEIRHSAAPGEKLADGQMAPFFQICVFGYPHENPVSTVIEVPLEQRRLEWLEQARHGDLDFDLRITLLATAFGISTWQKDGIQPNAWHAQQIEARATLKISRSVWIEKVLPGMDYGQIKVVEIPAVPLAQYKGLQHSFAALEKAEKQFKAGFYDDAAASCRIALEPFFEQVPKPDGTGTMPALKKSWERILGEATHEWLGKSMNAVKWATNSLHHSPTARFSRFDAQMLLSIVTALISYAARAAQDRQPGE